MLHTRPEIHIIYILYFIIWLNSVPAFNYIFKLVIKCSEKKWMNKPRNGWNKKVLWISFISISPISWPLPSLFLLSILCAVQFHIQPSNETFDQKNVHCTQFNSSLTNKNTRTKVKLKPKPSMVKATVYKHNFALTRYSIIRFR